MNKHAIANHTLQRPVSTVVVVGGGYAGVVAANRIAGRAGRNARVVLVTPHDEMIHRVRLHEMLAGTRQRRYPLRDVLHASVAIVRDEVVRVDADASRCVLASGQSLRYEQLVLAIGSKIDDALPGTREHGMALANPDTALAFATRLRALADGADVAVLGTGLTGIEVASEIAAAHPRLRVHLVGSSLAAGWPGSLRAKVQRELELLGVFLHTEANVSALHADAVILEDGARLPVAAAVCVAGFRCSALARESGLPVDELGRALVDETLRVERHPNIVVAGDIARAPLSCAGSGITPMRMACATAMPTGAHAADVVLDQLRARPPKRFRYRNTVQCVSLGRRRGMLVLIDEDDRPNGRVFGGALGALAKEVIVRGVIATLRLERRIPGAYLWPGAGRRTRIQTNPLPQLASHTTR